MSERSHIDSLKQVLYCAGGNCKSKNYIYFCTCVHCGLGYFGKTTTSINIRFNGNYSQIHKLNSDYEESDVNTLAVHAHKSHGINTRAEFNDCYKLYIVENLRNPTYLLRG